LARFKSHRDKVQIFFGLVGRRGYLFQIP